MLQDTFNQVNIADEKLNELISSYINTLSNYSSRTISSYSISLERFAAYTRSNPFRYSPDDLANYIIYLENKLQFKPNSINTNLTALRRFFSYLVLLAILEKNPARRICNRKSPVPKAGIVLSESQISGMIKNISSDDYASTRDRLIISLHFQYGLSKGIIRSVNSRDVQTHGKEAILVAISQGRRIRFNLDEATCQAIRKIHNLSEKKLRKDSPLFSSLSNRTKTERISIKGIKQVITLRLMAIHHKPTEIDVRSSIVNHLITKGLALEDIMKRMELKTLATIKKHHITQ